MYACVYEASNVIQEYKKLPSSGPRELTPAMIRSIEEADKLTKRGKKQEKKKEERVSKGAKGKITRKCKSEKAAPSQSKQKKTKKPARRLILPSSSDSDSEYLPTGHKQIILSESKSESFIDEGSVRGAQINAQTVNASVDIIKRSLEAEMTQLGVARKAIEAANEELHTKVDTRLIQLEAKLAVENRIMDELDKRTSQLKIQNLKLRTTTKELDDLKIEGVSETSVLPKQGGEKNPQGKTNKTQTQPPPKPKASAEPKDNEASVSHREKRKKNIGEDDVDEDDDI
ncbi:unnamed protein product [Lactuca saligna]|uniref:Uncharacterized protein n=1 Tax=Lactuca saligna TaxID=75948 RepID=A0AA35ZL03_LACSI|nr:unnamed protein product [Lactuca saligna]